MAIKKQIIKPVAAAVGVAFVSSLAISTTAHADENPFAMSDLDTGYMPITARVKKANVARASAAKATVMTTRVKKASAAKANAARASAAARKTVAVSTTTLCP